MTIPSTAPAPTGDMALFPGFSRHLVEVGDDVRIAAVVGGNGPPLLLLHGHPQTHAIWHRVAPALARRFTLVAADLRGYGDSSKPAGADDHANYAKRTASARGASLKLRDRRGRWRMTKMSSRKPRPRTRASVR